MEKVTFSVPAMWADHHVLAVREALSRVTGVEEVLASAMYKDVLVKYDPASVNPEVLKGALAEAGYEITKAPSIPTHPERIDDASDWFRFQQRITETDLRDLEMSGDHRKY
ncbi:MAG TPA: heavy-metal-associated domain-containing protein [Anaerolineae bacterium]|nr:heavy-metal-associated domain-containing protein [Anaerolineae bacterium]